VVIAGLIATAGVAGTLAATAGDSRLAAPAAPSEPPPRCAFAPAVGPDGYYDAQPFGANDHLGEDWNGTGGGNTDLGAPVSAIGDGIVTVAEDFAGGWGNVVRIAHACGESPGQAVESLYAHLHTIAVAPGARVRRGDRVGTIGTAHDRYTAHLHLELRERPALPLGPGYAADATGYLAPSPFIARNAADE
jgi:murein DD-endopeptidase MepM/ murein hydrolase activator NlpD